MLFPETKRSVQNLPSEATSSEDGVKYSLKTTCQSLPDANWRTGLAHLSGS